MAFSSGVNAAAPRNVRRAISDIDRLQLIDDILAAALVTGARRLPRDVEIDDQPALEGHGLQHTVAAGKIDLTIAQVEDAVAVERVGLIARGPLGVLIVGEHQARLMLFQSI